MAPPPRPPPPPSSPPRAVAEPRRGRRVSAAGRVRGAAGSARGMRAARARAPPLPKGRGVRRQLRARRRRRMRRRRVVDIPAVPEWSARAQCFLSWWRRLSSGAAQLERRPRQTPPTACGRARASVSAPTGRSPARRRRRRRRAGRRPARRTSSAPRPASRTPSPAARTPPASARTRRTRPSPCPAGARTAGARARRAARPAAAAPRRPPPQRALRRLPSSVTSPCTATPAGFTSTATQSSTCAHSSARSGSGVASRAARCSRGRITYSTVWPATAASATAAAAPSTTMSCLPHRVLRRLQAWKFGRERDSQQLEQRQFVLRRCDGEAGGDAEQLRRSIWPRRAGVGGAGERR